MKGLSYADERYLRVYTRDTVAWQILCFEAQCLWSLIGRKMTRLGTIDLGSDVTPAEAVAVLIGKPDRLAFVEAGLGDLLKRGWLVLEGTTLRDPLFVVAQEAVASAALRKRSQREREQAERDAESQTVTEESRNVTQPSRDVTSGHAGSQASRNVTPCRTVPVCSDPYRSDPDLEQQRDLDQAASPRAREVQPEPPQLQHSGGFLDPEKLRKRALWILGRMRDVHGGTGAYDFGVYREELEALALKPAAELEMAMRTYETDPWVPKHCAATNPQRLLRRFEHYVEGNPSGALHGPVRAKEIKDSEVVDELGVL